ncbi:MAG: S8 family serine peptidase, partial [Acidimicrobiales bacterium]
FLAEGVSGSPGAPGAAAAGPGRGAHPVADVLSRARGVEAVHLLGAGIVRFSGDPAIATRALARAGVSARVTPEHRLEWADVPNDPQFSQQWSLPAVRATDAWSITHGSSSVVVADVDSGVDATHPDLAGKLTAGYDAQNNTPLAPGNTDTVGHGTEVAGVIGAATNNGLGLASLGWDTVVMPIKVGGTPTTGPVAAGIHWAVDHGARIVNLSLGGCADPLEAEAVNYAQVHGALVVASAGNSANLGNPVSYPAAYPGVLAVGATGRDGTRAFYSETGPYVGMVAPGGSADGLASDDLALLEMGGGFGTGSGTSFAAPMVAAAAALVQARSPLLGAADVAGVLKGTATDLGPPGRDDQYGTGLLQAAAAVVAAGKLARLAGPTRYDTAAAVSRDAFPGGASNVYVASGTNFADALATGPLTKPRAGPLLLTDPCSLPVVTGNELSRLNPSSITVVGGESAICPAVLTAIQSQTGVVPTRVAGPTRYDTAAALSRMGWPTTSPTVYVASGFAFPDGLSGGPRAALDGAPLLLTDTCTLPAATNDELVRLHPSKVVVLGGTAAVCDAVLAAMGTATGAQVGRLAGQTRYETAAVVARDGWSSGASTVFLASGAAFPDALASGPGAVVAGGPVLLADGGSCAATGPTLDVTRTLHPGRVVAVGGTSALCGDAAGQVAAAAG